MSPGCTLWKNLSVLVVAAMLINISVAKLPTSKREALQCQPKQFLCASGDQCVYGWYQCDGSPDCRDASDERNCIKVCTAEEFRCSANGGHCLPSSMVCDGKPDCPDMSDEDYCSDPDPVVIALSLFKELVTWV